MVGNWTHRRSYLRVAFALALTTVAAVPLQAQLSVAVTGGTVRYEGLATTGSVAVSPDLLVTRQNLLFDANISASSATDGTRLIHGGTTLWGVTPPLAPHVQLTGLVQVQATKPTGFAGSSALVGFGELALADPGKGIAIGIGGASGKLEGQPAVNALRTGARAWVALGQASLAVSAQPTRLAGSWFTDYDGRVQLTNGAWWLMGGLTLREGSGITRSSGMDGTAIWGARGPVALELTGGRYLRDPYQALPAGWYATAGVRFTLWTAPSAGLNSNVGQASLSNVGIAGQTAIAAGTRSVPSVTKTVNLNSAGGTGRAHRP